MPQSLDLDLDPNNAVSDSEEPSETRPFWAQGAVASPTSSSETLPYLRTARNLKLASKEERDLFLQRLIKETLAYHMCKPSEAAKRLTDILAKYELNWEVIEALALTNQYRLMDVFFIIFKTASDNKCATYRFYSFWLLALHRRTDYVTFPVLDGVALTNPLPIHGGALYDLYLGEFESTLVSIKVPRTLGQSQEDCRKILKAFERELAGTLYTRHPNILAPIGVAPYSILSAQFSSQSDIDPANGLLLIYPYFLNGRLDEYVNQHPHVNRILLLYELADALAFLHSDTDPALVHGDIKPDNALIDQNGRAVWIDTIGSGTAGGSSLDVGLFGRYAAPELYQPEQRAAGQEGHLLGEDIVKTPASDVYAFAMTLYEIVSGSPVFEGLQAMMILVRVMRGDRPERPDSPFVTDQLWALIEDSWHSDPKQRPTMKFIAQQLEAFAKLPLYNSGQWHSSRRTYFKRYVHISLTDDDRIFL